MRVQREQVHVDLTVEEHIRDRNNIKKRVEKKCVFVLSLPLLVADCSNIEQRSSADVMTQDRITAN